MLIASVTFKVVTLHSNTLSQCFPYSRHCQNTSFGILVRMVIACAWIYEFL